MPERAGGAAGDGVAGVDGAGVGDAAVGDDAVRDAAAGDEALGMAAGGAGGLSTRGVVAGRSARFGAGSGITAGASAARALGLLSTESVAGRVAAPVFRSERPAGGTRRASAGFREGAVVIGGDSAARTEADGSGVDAGPGRSGNVGAAAVVLDPAAAEVPDGSVVTVVGTRPSQSHTTAFATITVAIIQGQSRR